MTLPPDEPPILRDRVAEALAASPTPIAVAELARMLLPADLPSAARQIARALRQLEAAGTAVRQRGKPWATPDQWRAAR